VTSVKDLHQNSLGLTEENNTILIDLSDAAAML
jgi:hypothetical protein